MTETAGQQEVTEYFRTPLYLEKLMQILFLNKFAPLEQYRTIMNKLVNNLVECIIKRPDIARRFVRNDTAMNYLPFHSINVAVYAINTGICMDYKEEELLELALGALLHDAGMAFVPESVLDRSTPLTPEELFLIQRHPESGQQVLENEKFRVRQIIVGHHEKYKGGGYPKGSSFRFSGGYLASIVSLADAFDAMTSFRIYKAPMKIDAARKKIIEEEEEAWPGEIVLAFLKGLNRMGF